MFRAPCANTNERRNLATKALTTEQAQDAINALAENGNVQKDAAASLKLHPATYRNRLAAAYRMKLSATRTSELAGALAKAAKVAVTARFPLSNDPAFATATVADDTVQLRDRVFELETLLKTVKKETLTDAWVRRKIIGLNTDIGATQAPQWVAELPRGDTLPGVPTAFWSDWHWGEVVFPAQVNGVNEFNLEIAHRRGKALLAKTIYLLRKHIVNPSYPGIVLALGGDMMSGDIHEELTETNEIEMMPCLLDLYAFLLWAIRALADEFGKVFVPCVTGNHGRNTKRYRAKGRNFSNFDWLLYQFLEKAFADDDRVTFFIPEGSDALYTVAGHKYLLTHGDQFRGGDGMIGHFGPVLRGQKKKQSRNANIGLEFDTLIHGHFHTYFPTDKIIGNGSLKGLDEYAFQGNFGYEPPIQGLWLTHPEHGVTIHMPVYLERHAGKTANTKADWVTWHRDA